MWDNKYQNLKFLGYYTTNQKFVKIFKDKNGEDVTITFNAGTEYETYDNGDGRILLRKSPRGGIAIELKLSKEWFKKLFKAKKVYNLLEED